MRAKLAYTALPQLLHSVLYLVMPQKKELQSNELELFEKNHYTYHRDVVFLYDIALSLRRIALALELGNKIPK